MFEVIFLSDVTDLQFISLYMNIISIAKVIYHLRRNKYECGTGESCRP
jgi:hypothetical protein